MTITIIKWLIVALSLLNSGYMAYDGTKALVKGDYIRPKTGEYAGQLGPWSKLVQKMGIDPMSSFMKSVFVVYGIIGLFITICFVLNIPWSWKAMLVFNIACCWNLFFGTVSSVLLVILLIVFRSLK